MQLSLVDSPISLDSLTACIRKSSNFRFDWQFYRCEVIETRSPAGIRHALDSIIATPELHEFLRISFDPMYSDEFEIQPLHEHCQIVAAEGEFEDILARAAGDHLGAYSRKPRDATAREKKKIRNQFETAGEYQPYKFVPSSRCGCAACGADDHLFSTWFYGVAWDWCLFAAWPHRNLLWMGCLTDTD